MSYPIRCNHCMHIMEEHEDHNVVECSKCGKDDALDDLGHRDDTSPNFKQAPHLFDEMVSEINTEAWNKFKGGK